MPTIGGLYMPNISGDAFDAFQKGQEVGIENKRRRTLADYASGAIGGDQGALAKVMGVDPNAGMKLQEYGQGQQDRQTKLADDQRATFARDVATMAKLPRPLQNAMYRARLPDYERMFPGQKFDADLTDEFAAQLPQIASALSGENSEATAQERAFAAMTQGMSPDDVLKARRIKLKLDPGAGYTTIQTADGYGVFNKQDATVAPLNYGGGQPQQDGSPQASQGFGQSGGGAQVLDDALVNAVMQQESGGDPNAVSSAGARGLMQLMPGTQRDPGFGIAPARDDSPQENMRVGREYLNAMLGRYKGNQTLALAAYNAGPGRVDQALAQAGGDPQRAIALLPQETRNYVQQVPARMGQQSAQPQGRRVMPATKGGDAPSGYQWNADGTGLVPIPGGPADRKNNPTNVDMAKGEMGIRKELQDRVKQDRSILGMYRNVENAAKSGTAAGDLSMIFAYMKMLDPGSVVREQEFANAQNATGVPDRIRNLYNQAISGNRLNPKQREEFIAEARQLAAGAQQRVTSETRDYQSIAEQYGYDTTRATGAPDFRNVQTRSLPTEPPAAGGKRKVVRTGTQNGRKVVQYSDGSVDYAD